MIASTMFKKPVTENSPDVLKSAFEHVVLKTLGDQRKQVRLTAKNFRLSEERTEQEAENLQSCLREGIIDFIPDLRKLISYNSMCFILCSMFSRTLLMPSMVFVKI